MGNVVTLEQVLQIGVPLLLALLVGALLVRYAYWTIEQEGGRLARLERDPEFRRQTLVELDQRLAAAPRDWRALRLRADLRRFDGDWRGVIGDLLPYLELRPGDDAGWQELAEAQLETGDAAAALASVERALALDPFYSDHHALRARAALAAKRTTDAREALDEWQALLHERAARAHGRRQHPDWPQPTAPEKDPRLLLMRAAVLQAEGQTAEADELLSRALRTDHAVHRADLDRDPALRPLLDLPEGQRLP